MKPTTLALALCLPLSALAGSAYAGHDTAQPLRGVEVQSSLPHASANRPLGDCTPPSDLAICERLHARIRQAFTPKEIRMLFGAWSSHPQYLTTYMHVSQRYRDFLRAYEDESAMPLASR